MRIFAKAFLLLGTEPLIGAPIPRRNMHGVRRLHLARIRYHLYYRIRRRTVEVIAFCHTSRGVGPSSNPLP